MTKTKNEMAVVYARYSSHHQQETSIEGQLAAARKYAEAKSYTIVKEYCDRAKTGTNDNREAFQKMLRDCSKHQFSVIIVWKVDRFGRNREEITFNKYKAKKHGVRVEYVAENISEGPEGVILESVLEGMAEYYSLQLAQNVKRGLYEAAKKHHVVGGHVPLGYRVAADKTYELNPDEVPIVKMIFERYASGETLSELMTYLNDHGYRTALGRPFTKNSLPRLLSNERYTGVFIYQDIRDEGAIPAIIDKDLFEKVQKMLSINRKMPSHKWSYSDFILSEKLFCGLCGARMTGESGYGKLGTKYGYYVCQDYRKKKTCDMKPIKKDWIEDLVIAQVDRILKDEELMTYIADRTWEYYQEQDEDQTEIENIQKQLAQTEKGISNLVRSLELGVASDTIAGRINELEAEKTALKKALADKNLEKGVKLTRDHILFFLQKLGEGSIDDRESQRRLIETFVNAVYVDPEKIRIAFNYTTEGSLAQITLDDIKKHTDDEGFVCVCNSRALPTAHEPISLFILDNVFIISIRTA